VENRVCFSRGVKVHVWWTAMRIVAGAGDLVQRTGNDHIGRVLGNRTIGRPGDVMCGLQRARGDVKRVFLS
jgi:hypothetical protein